MLDASRYVGAGHNSSCDDNPGGPNPPTRFNTIGDLKFPPGTDLRKTITATGGIWRSWGWYVTERDGFRKPNQFGYGPDGYRLQVVTAAREGYPPTLQGSSPCFPGELARDDIPIPAVLKAD